MMATMIGNQSERSKFGLDQSESRISTMWLFDVTNQGFGHVTPWNQEHTHTRVESTFLA